MNMMNSARQANAQIEPILSEQEPTLEKIKENQEAVACSIENPEDCEMCGS